MKTATVAVMVPLCGAGCPPPTDSSSLPSCARRHFLKFVWSLSFHKLSDQSFLVTAEGKGLSPAPSPWHRTQKARRQEPPRARPVGPAINTLRQSVSSVVPSIFWQADTFFRSKKHNGAKIGRLRTVRVTITLAPTPIARTRLNATRRTRGAGTVASGSDA